MATHNVNADNPDPAATARDVAASGADMVALEELPASAVPAYGEALEADVPLPRGAWARSGCGASTR